MISLSSISESGLEQVRELYESSFPLAERRDWQQFVYLFHNEPRSRCMAITDDGIFRGFVCHWLFEDYVYVEHFAVMPEYRDKGIGAAALEALRTQYGKPLFLEAENPEHCADKALAERRLAFYERCGFRVFNTDYEQPIYRAGDDMVPLYLLTTGEDLTAEQIENFKSIVYAAIDPLLHYEERTDSTNSALTLANAEKPLPDKYAIYTFNQPFGRGQRGNTWEAEPGKNILISWLMRPKIHVSQQFTLNQAVCYIVMRWLGTLVPEEQLCIKWPNDIYYDDNKIAGILIEHVIVGDTIDHSIVGVGININQMEFVSDAPNPVSVVDISRHITDLHTAAIRLHSMMCDYVKVMNDAHLHDIYFEHLYRNEGYHRYRLPDGEGFKAKIIDVEPDGMLVLEKEDGKRQKFAFKEIIFTH